ncbi:MAG: 50S ribosomal protein L17 [Bacteroidales bacterium]|nr:50S ribosomal protein L17 [Bacteroidales bacterium]
MRHGKKFNHLGRNTAHRKAMLSNMATSLILHKRIKTTLAKAKALRVYVEPLVTRSKSDTTHDRRMVFSYLQSKEAVSELFGIVSEKVANRPGGYTRIIKLGTRLGDNAEMCMIELVDFNEYMLNQKADSQKAEKTTRRSRRGGKKKETAEPVAEVAAETPVVEEAIAEVETTVEVVEETKADEITGEKASEEATEEKSSDEKTEEKE